MPTSKTKLKNAAIAAKSAALPAIPKELIDQFVTGPMSGEAVNAASMAFKKALIERALGAELGHHLGYPNGADKPEATSNQRNGASAKTVLTEDGPLRIEVPRDREGSFEPLLIPKHDRRFTGFDDKIVAMYARGMTVREIQGFLTEQYGTEVAPDFISSVTDAVMAEVGAWQVRPLEPMYPVVFFDALRVKIREDAVVRNKAIYLALGVLPDGTRDILGLWIEGTEGAKFWMKVFNGKFPTVAAAWRRAWDRVIPFFAFPPAVRRVIYTTNAIESVNARLRKIIKTRGHFPSDYAASKLIWLALRNITAEWERAAHDWKTAMNQFAILYQDRFTRQQA